MPKRTDYFKMKKDDFNNLLSYLYEHRVEDSVTELMVWCCDKDKEGALKFYKNIVAKSTKLKRFKNLHSAEFYSQQVFYIRYSKDEKKKLKKKNKTFIPDILCIGYDKNNIPKVHLVIECKIDAKLGGKKNYRHLNLIENNFFFLLCPESRKEGLKTEIEKKDLGFEFEFITYGDFLSAFENHKNPTVQQIVNFINGLDKEETVDYLILASKYLSGRKENVLSKARLFDKYMRRVTGNIVEISKYYHTSAQSKDTDIFWFNTYESGEDKEVVRFFLSLIRMISGTVSE